ncbi:MAG TPA: GNAT family N-acetyltransferase [Candidatus Tumulicola sp.]|nr:GNAT family N-acetyltransferase [Candidatus Tumulicola sp.]
MLEYLTAAPYDNVFVSYLVLFDRSVATRSQLLVARDQTRVRGVAYFGHQLVLSGDGDAVAAFAQRARTHDGERTIAGPRAAVRAFWALVRDGRPAPRIVRDRQLVMAVDRSRLRSHAASVRVRHARAAEWRAIADGSAVMIEQELGYDPRRRAPDFAANVRAMISQERWWVGEFEGRLCFLCSIGPWCRLTAQLQGVWTPPELRGRGLASASLAAICDRLLTVSPTLSLHVNDFNRDAIALYRRVGFEHVSDYQTLLF